MACADLTTRLPPRASRPSADSLFRMGLSLSTPGAGMQNDPVAAHALFDLAARLGSIEAKIYRRELGDEMDPADVAEAQKIAREWLAEA
jgi:TPR repeat protein